MPQPRSGPRRTPLDVRIPPPWRMQTPLAYEQRAVSEDDPPQRASYVGRQDYHLSVTPKARCGTGAVVK